MNGVDTVDRVDGGDKADRVDAGDRAGHSLQSALQGGELVKLLMKFLARAGVAVVGLSLLFVIGYVGGWLFFAVVALLAILALSEYYSALQRKQMRPNVGLGWLCALLILFVTQESEMIRILAGPGADGSGLPVASYEASADVLQLILGILLFCVAGTLVAQFKMRGGQSAVVNSATTVFGVVYVGILLSFVLRMRYVDVPALMGEGEIACQFARRMGGLLLVIAPIWFGDTAAFLVGNLWGRVKLAPRVSPGKTVEGSTAGLLAALLGALVVGTWWLGMPVIDSALLGLMMGTVGQLGDLGKSVLKRDIGIKDFGSLFGPHGGVLDRFDAILFTMPVVYWYFWFLVMKSAGG